MKSAVIIFPGSNRDRDMIAALTNVTGTAPLRVWHTEPTIPEVDLIVLPGGFSYGDYLRAGAIAARSPVMADVIAKAEAGIHVLGVCNGFQMLTEAELLPGALMRNAGLNFICKQVTLRVDNNETAFSNAYSAGQVVDCPVAHHDGNYFADPATLSALEDSGRIIFRYANDNGELTDEANPNGSLNNIAGIMNDRGNVLGMMPHPENLIESLHGGTDGRGLFESLVNRIG